MTEGIESIIAIPLSVGDDQSLQCSLRGKGCSYCEFPLGFVSLGGSGNIEPDCEQETSWLRAPEKKVASD